MKDKLPVVGKRYRKKSDLNLPHYNIECVGFQRNFKELYVFRFYNEENPHRIDLFSLNYFLENYEELPETQSHISELSPEVKEAMEKLEKHVENYKGWDVWLFDYAKTLLNALDKQFNLNGYFEGLPPSKEAIEKQFANNKTQAEEVADNKIEEESIWKPVSKIRESGVIILKDKNGKVLDITRTSKEFFEAKSFAGVACYLDDFINDYEKLKERIRKLEVNS